jgi:hypothetical protein
MCCSGLASLVWFDSRSYCATRRQLGNLGATEQEGLLDWPFFYLAGCERRMIYDVMKLTLLIVRCRYFHPLILIG